MAVGFAAYYNFEPHIPLDGACALLALFWVCTYFLVRSNNVDKCVFVRVEGFLFITGLLPANRQAGLLRTLCTRTLEDGMGLTLR